MLGLLSLNLVAIPNALYVHSRAYFFFFLGIQILLEKKAIKVQFHMEKNQEIMAALHYKPQPWSKMSKKEYKSQLIIARVPYSLFIVFKSELYRAKNQLDLEIHF